MSCKGFTMRRYLTEIDVFTIKGLVFFKLKHFRDYCRMKDYSKWRNT